MRSNLELAEALLSAAKGMKLDDERACVRDLISEIRSDTDEISQLCESDLKFKAYEGYIEHLRKRIESNQKHLDDVLEELATLDILITALAMFVVKERKKADDEQH